MKNQIRYIVLSYVLLAFFSVGQFITYAHQHPVNCSSVAAADQHKATSQKTFDYKCSVCQLIGHAQMILFQDDALGMDVAIKDTFYTLKYSCQHIHLIAFVGRGPPQG